MKQNHFKRLTLDGDWALAYGYHRDFDKDIVSLDAAKSSGLKILPAKVATVFWNGFPRRISLPHRPVPSFIAPVRAGLPCIA